MIECYSATTEEILQALRDRAIRQRQSAAVQNLARDLATPARTVQVAEFGTVASIPPPEELPGLLAACSETQRHVGTVNPRNPGLLNTLIQSAKKLMQRSLSWYTRSFGPFHLAVTGALYSFARVQQDLLQHTAAMEQRLNALILKSPAGGDEFVEANGPRGHTTAELFREIDELSERLRCSELRMEKLMADMASGGCATPASMDLPK